MQLKPFLIPVVALLLSGCGFRPLYVPSEQACSEDIHQAFSLIKIKSIPDRMGLQLRNALLDLLNPYGEPKTSKYILQVSIQENKSGFGFRKDATPKRSRLNYLFHFSLIDTEKHHVCYGDTAEVDASFSTGSKAEMTSIPYMVTEERQRQRAMEQGAHEIKILLASYFAAQHLSRTSKDRP